MKAVTLCLLCLVVVGSRANPFPGVRFPIRNTDDRDNECNEDCSTQSPKPVCGSDGRTYNSRCELMIAQCRGSTVQVEHRGTCQESSSRCEAERRHNQDDAKVSKGLFIPDCNDDGSYRQVQCHTGTGYCWCVTNQGKPIPGSSVQNKEPNCNGDNGRPKTKQGKRRRRKGCSQSERQEFNNNLITIFKDEYARLPTKPPVNNEEYMVNFNLRGLSAIDELMDSHEKQVIDWKFSELDTNSNGELNKKELRSITKMIKKIVEPRACARNFAESCDLDQDGMITNGEWAVCLGIDNISFQLFLSLNTDEDEQAPEPEIVIEHPILPKDSAEFVDKNPSDEPDRELTARPGLPIKGTDEVSSKPVVEHSCTENRQTALAEAAESPDDGIFIPECEDDGSYTPVQCHQAMKPTYCWCVLTDIGRPIVGTSKQNGMPNCDRRPTAPDREIKGCPGNKKDRFLTTILDILTTEMVDNANNNEGVDTEPNPEDTLEESTVKWKFRQLDKNKNNLLDKKEVSKFRKEIKSLKPKKCARNFAKHCDENEDKKITLSEWLDCFDLNQAEDKKSEKPLGPNPFTIWLNPVDKLQ
ncbi:SPARC-related modular calcium-binding protein 1-like isoform X3 [Glandiceps talaboti]